MDKQFKRTVTNVGDGSATYNVKVTAPNNSVVRVSPERLVFGLKKVESMCGALSWSRLLSYSAKSFAVRNWVPTYVIQF